MNAVADISVSALCNLHYGFSKDLTTLHLDRCYFICRGYLRAITQLRHLKGLVQQRHSIT